MLLLIELGRWEFKIERHRNVEDPAPEGAEYVPTPMQVHTPDYVGFLPTQYEER